MSDWRTDLTQKLRDAAARGEIPVDPEHIYDSREPAILDLDDPASVERLMSAIHEELFEGQGCTGHGWRHCLEMEGADGPIIERLREDRLWEGR